MATVKNKITIQLLGAAGVVTGSKYLIKAFGKSILIDCGLFQGLKELRLLNWEPFPVDASSIDLVLLTHGHLDHTGYLPKLVNAGFEGEIWATAPTLDVTSIILKDSARVQEEDAERANAENFSKHAPAKPLYDLKDVEKTIPHFYAKPLDEWIKIDDTISCRYRYNGHIIGATFIELKIGERIFVFSGDIGRKEEPLMRTPEQPDYADVLFVESTYGNRIHASNPEQELSNIINENSTRNGTIIIPSFAVERTQLLMYTLWQLKKKNLIPNIPVYMDSPMGLNVLEVFIRHNDWHKLSLDDCYEMCSEIRLVKTMEETLKIAAEKKSKIIIAGSGMATGGRVLTYLQQY
ncbi:MAG: MBL fold metallo-hydrolase, partial [Bacteroidia bacterium]